MKERILVAHNAYQLRGGEDSVVEAEVALLENKGHLVKRYVRHNDEIPGASSIGLMTETFWSRQTQRELEDIFDKFRPDAIHVHNTFPLISPSLYWAAHRRRIPVIQTLHNFRLLCPQAMFLRQGKVCEDCLGVMPWRGAIRGCYRNSVGHTSVLAFMLATHRLMGTYSGKVTRYIALNNFCREKFVAGGLPASKISVKPNFVDFPRKEDGERSGGLFVGRLMPEKGLETLVEALKQLPQKRLTIVGDGPEAFRLKGQPGIIQAGQLQRNEVMKKMRLARWLVMPSIWYETFGMVLIEAYASSLPVIASRLGAMADLVEEGVTGLLFNPGDPVDLAAKMLWAEQHPEAMRKMGENARKKYEEFYTPDANYQQLMAIYRQAISEA